MSERKKVDVNEDAVMKMMANDKQSYLTGVSTEKEPESPIISEILPDSPVLSDSDSEQPKEENPRPETDSGKAPKKRKVPKSDFAEQFLKERIVKNRKQIYISVEAYDMIRRYLKYIGDVSFIAYVDNILLQHIEEHKDTISEMFDKKVKPF
jgi:hypothetical protein